MLSIEKTFKLFKREAGLTGSIKSFFNRKHEYFSALKNINLNIKHKKSLAQAYEVAKNYAKNPEGWLTFYGPTGVGKTHLAIAIFMNLKAKGHDAMFVFVPDMLDELRNSYSGDNDGYYCYISSYYDYHR